MALHGLGFEVGKDLALGCSFDDARHVIMFVPNSSSTGVNQPWISVWARLGILGSSFCLDSVTSPLRLPMCL